MIHVKKFFDQSTAGKGFLECEGVKYTPESLRKVNFVLWLFSKTMKAQSGEWTKRYFMVQLPEYLYRIDDDGVEHRFQGPDLAHALCDLLVQCEFENSGYRSFNGLHFVDVQQRNPDAHLGRDVYSYRVWPGMMDDQIKEISQDVFDRNGPLPSPEPELRAPVDPDLDINAKGDDGRIFKYDEIRQYVLDDMEHFGGLDNEDLHHEMLNMDYYVIGTYNAEQWLGSQVFECIRTVHEYEDLHFGERHTDTSDPEKLVTMYAYIIGEQIINTMREEQDD